MVAPIRARWNTVLLYGFGHAASAGERGCAVQAKRRVLHAGRAGGDAGALGGSVAWGSAAGPVVRRWSVSRRARQQRWRGTNAGGGRQGEGAGAAGAGVPSGVLCVGGTSARSGRTLRLRGRQSALHSLSDVGARRADVRVGSVSSFRRRVFGLGGFVGTLLGRLRQSAAAWRPDGVRRASRLRPCTLRGAARRTPRRALPKRAHRRRPTQAFPTALRGLLAVVRGRLRWFDGGDEIRRRRCNSQVRRAAIYAGAGCRRRVAEQLESAAAPLSRQRPGSLALLGGCAPRGRACGCQRRGGA